MAQKNPLIGSACSLKIDVSATPTVWQGAYSWTLNQTQERREDTNFSSTAGTISYLPGLPVTTEVTVTAEVVDEDAAIWAQMTPGTVINDPTFYVDADHEISSVTGTVASVDGPNVSRRNSSAVEMSVTILLNGTITEDFSS